MPAFGKPCRDAEVFQEWLVMRAFHDLPHAGDHGVVACVNAAFPEAAGPMYLVQRKTLYLSVWGLGDGRESQCKEQRDCSGFLRNPTLC